MRTCREDLPGGIITSSYWDTETSGTTTGIAEGGTTGFSGKTTAELQAPTGYAGIYAEWNTDLDNADGDDNPATGTDDFWTFGTTSQYPALKIDLDGDGTATTPAPEPDCGGIIDSDGTVSGTWAAGCESAVSGRGYARYYSFTLEQSSEVTITLERTSGDADTYLYLRAGEARSGAFLYENDDDGGTTRSRIEETLASGTYTVEATTNSAGAIGSFTLTITVEDLLSVIVSRAPGIADTPVMPGSPVALIATFSRPVSGFASDDINVENGTVSNFAGTGDVYTFDVTQDDIDEVTTVHIAAGVAQDADDNGNEASPRFYLGIPYDDDGDGTVSRVEVIAAIRDYFDGKITRAQAIAVIRLYFA